MVRDRIRYQDLQRQPYTPPAPDIHHRNETLIRLGDPWLAMVVGKSLGAFSWGARAGISIPLGRTEENPFELGHHGLPHQHIQFGTGTWDPVLSGFASSQFRALTLQAQANARLAFGENQHGYQAGDRYNLSVLSSRDWSAGWHGTAGFDIAREEAERWDGKLEEEGNLGRTDLALVLGVQRSFPPLGAFGLTSRIPLSSRVSGEQMDQPFVLTLHWSR